MRALLVASKCTSNTVRSILPVGMPKPLLAHLKTVWVAGQQLKISPLGSVPASPNHAVAPPTGPRRSGAERRVADKAPKPGGKVRK